MSERDAGPRRILVGVTGASGAPYAVALLRRRLCEVYLALSSWGRMVMREETGLREADLQPLVSKMLPENSADVGENIATAPPQVARLPVKVLAMIFGDPPWVWMAPPVPKPVL